jgi:hypothetical protein
LTQQILNPCRKTVARFCILLPRALQHGPESLSAERLQQVVKCVNLERPQSVLIMRRHKNNAWHLFLGDRLNDSEAVHPRHLHIQEDQIRPMFPDRGNRRFRPTRLADHPHIRLLTQKPQNLSPRGRFIVDNQYLECVSEIHVLNQNVQMIDQNRSQ